LSSGYNNIDKTVLLYSDEGEIYVWQANRVIKWIVVMNGIASILALVVSYKQTRTIIKEIRKNK
jgi:hypothetical protein